MSISAVNGERCEDGKNPRLSSPTGPPPEPQKRSLLLEPQEGSPLPEPQGGSPLTEPEEGSPLPEPEEGSPLPEPEEEESEEEEEEESPPKKRRGPRCKYPRHVLPPGMAPDYEYQSSSIDPENIPYMDDPRLLEMSQYFADAALSYLSQQGHHFELVRLDDYEGGTVSGGARFHHNFQAKPALDPDAPPQTFFCQVFLRKDRALCALTDLTVECCVSLGPSDSLPKKRDSRDCAYCTIFIHHPKDGCEGMIC